MTSRVSLLALLLLAGALVACSDQSNQVVGGVSTSPPLLIRAVRSSIFAQVTATAPSGGQTSANAVVLAETENLCELLGQKPDLFKSTDTAFIALILLTPQSKLGSFYFTASGNVSAAFASSYGTGTAPLVWAGVGGNISIGEFDSGSNATGNFDVLFADLNNNQFEAYGVFKSDPCPALASAFVPRVP